MDVSADWQKFFQKLSFDPAPFTKFDYPIWFCPDLFEELISHAAKIQAVYECVMKLV